MNYKAFVAEYNSFPLGNRDDVEEKDFLNISNSSIFEYQSRKRKDNQDLDVLMNGRKVRLNQRLDARMKSPSMSHILSNAGTECQSPGLSGNKSKRSGPITVKI